MEGTKGQKATLRFNTRQCGVSLEQHGAELDSTVLQPISSGRFVCRHLLTDKHSTPLFLGFSKEHCQTHWHRGDNVKRHFLAPSSERVKEIWQQCFSYTSLWQQCFSYTSQSWVSLLITWVGIWELAQRLTHCSSCPCMWHKGLWGIAPGGWGSEGIVRVTASVPVWGDSRRIQQRNLLPVFWVSHLSSIVRNIWDQAAQPAVFVTGPAHSTVRGRGQRVNRALPRAKLPWEGQQHDGWDPVGREGHVREFVKPEEVSTNLKIRKFYF